MIPAPETPWSVLGLEPATATQRHVRLAAAKRIDQFRLDSDWEGIRGVHEAYGKVLAELLLERKGDAPSDAVMMAPPATAARAPDASPDDVLRELRAGAMSVAAQMLDHWHVEGNMAAMVATGIALTTNTDSAALDHPACGHFALRLAFRLALAQPGGAALLVDAAIKWLPASDHSLLPAVERRLNLGRLFWHLPPEWQSVWEGALDQFDQGLAPNWDSAPARNAFAALIRVSPEDWPGWAFFQSILRPARWRELVRLFHSQPVGGRPWDDPPAQEWIAPRSLPAASADVTASPEPLPPGERLPMKSSEADLWEIHESAPAPSQAARAAPEKSEPPPVRPDVPKPLPKKDASWDADEAEHPARDQAEPRHRPRNSRDAKKADKLEQWRRAQHHDHRSLKRRWQKLSTGTKFVLAGVGLPLVLALGGLVASALFTTVGSMARRPDKNPLAPDFPTAAPDARPVRQDSATMTRIDEVIQRAPVVREELERFLAADAVRQDGIVESGGNLPAGREAHMSLLACVILHPDISLDMKQRAIDKITRACPPEVAITIFRTAMIPGSPASASIIQSTLGIFREHGDELSPELRKQLQALEERERREKSRGIR